MKRDAAMTAAMERGDWSAYAEAAYAAGRREALEQAAAYCEATMMSVAYGQTVATHGGYVPTPAADWGNHQGMGYAAAIRALSAEAPDA